VSDCFDVIVVGAGHAGCEAAIAAARLGLTTALVTVRLEDTAKMSCNPAVGGIAKGHMVRELDALGGVMGLVTDRAGIQFKLLNRGRGPAVRSPRAQCDKALYSMVMGETLAATPGLERVAGVVNHVRLERGRVAAIELDDGRRLGCRAAVITPGTFLNGRIHIGERKLEGGRIGEHAARALSECLAELGLERGRLKTGTPPRLHRDSIDWNALEPQPGDEPPLPFSHWTERLELDQVPCHLTRTNARTHEVIRRNLHRSPLYSGEIRGTGPRYCPSLEDKVVKFPERVSHQVFLEPEGRQVVEIYVNGVSSSMPAEVQLEFVRTMTGMERAEMLRPGYAVEYDFVLPHQLRPTLEVKGVPGLFLAGQICGTSGYEEAAAQGWVAGVNAARQVRGQEPIVLRRDQAYVGVLIDDLVTREHCEPYRMFTSAAEHRLLLRTDNADERLAALAFEIGLLTREQVEQVRAKYAAIESEESRLSRVTVRAIGAPPGSALDRVARQGGSYRELASHGVSLGLPEPWAECLEVRARYRGYIERQRRLAEQAQRLDQVALPDSLWESELRGISREGAEKLRRWRPGTAGQAARIAGVSPADVAVLLVLLRKASAGAERC
jgi:tRNA uridine 5-carboxymethylaminomethyl modification enzyme